MKSLDRAVALFILLGVAAPVFAQVQAAVRDDPAKAQVQAFEMVLRMAVDRGGQRFLEEAARTLPGLVASSSDAPVVFGAATRDVTGASTLYSFFVQVPTQLPVLQTSLIMELMNQDRRSAPPQRVANPGAVRSGGVSATGTVDADPMAASPIISEAGEEKLMRDYSEKVRASLIDALIDNALMLPLGTGDEILIVTTGSDDGASADPLFRNPARKLILRVNGADLTELRQGKITKEEAKQRVRQSYF